MQTSKHLPTLIYSRNGQYYFSRRHRSNYIRITLRTNDKPEAQRRANLLYLYTNKLKRLEVATKDAMRMARSYADQLHEEWLLAQLAEGGLPAGSDLSDDLNSLYQFFIIQFLQFF